jgi:rod shape-determining protein MreC
MKRGLITVFLFIALYFLKGFFQNAVFQLSAAASHLGILGVFEQREDRSQEDIAKILKENQSQALRIEDLESENKSLKRALELKRSLKDPIAANISYVIEEELRTKLLIDKGSRDNIKKHSAAITSEGFLGIVDEVGLDYSIVLPYFDPGFSISARISSSRDIALLVGRGKGVNLKLLYIDLNSEIKAGDGVVTSGKGLLPGGITIGSIVDIYMDDSQIYKIAEVKPFVEISKIGSVVIIRVD